jgi:hypothetical protein
MNVMIKILFLGFITLINASDKYDMIIKKTINRLNDHVQMANLTEIKEHPTFLIPILCNGYFCNGIQEGYVGIVNYQGSIVNKILMPGGYWYDMHGTKEIIQIKLLDEDIVKNVQCITSEGILLTFPAIKVRNQIAVKDVLDTIRRYGIKYDESHIYQRVQSEMLDICSQLTAPEIMFTLYDKINELLLNSLIVENKRFKTNVLIQSVVITDKPIAPKAIQDNYEKLALAESATKVLEAEKLRVQMEKEKELIEVQGASMIIQEKTFAENRKKIDEHQAQVQISFEKVEAKKRESLIEFEIKLKSAQTEAESNRLIAESLQAYWNNPGWVSIEQAKAIAPATKIYGEKIPSVFLNSNLFDNDKSKNS